MCHINACSSIKCNISANINMKLALVTKDKTKLMYN